VCISYEPNCEAVYDAAVIGGGPGGAVAALCLARLGWVVALPEATSADEGAYGETLPPECNPLLRSLGLWEAFQRSRPLESPGIVSCWGQAAPAQQDFISNVHGSGWHVDRARFDEELRTESVRAGVTVLRGARVKAIVRENGWWRFNGMRARFVVDATGRNGFRLGAPAGRELDDNLVVLVLRIAHPGGRPSDLRTQIVAALSGWWYWTPVPDGNSIAMFFTCRE
jgi:2-polyprenyl-6-methoxyphenol hydroxylase-like FAD-dependent oxidoreductase